MTARELEKLAQQAISDVGLSDTTLASMNGPHGQIWKLEFAGLKAAGPDAIAIGVAAEDGAEQVAANIRHELRIRRCPVCRGRAEQSGHVENGQHTAAIDVRCEQCERPYVITFPAALAFRAAAERNEEQVLGRLPDLQRAIRGSHARLEITQDNWLGVVEFQGRRRRPE